MVRAVTRGPGNFSGVGAGWAGMEGGSVNGIYPVHLLNECCLVSWRGRTEKIVGCGVWKEECVKG